jgi:two-component system KDP operon response regulator KdpE
MKNQPLVLVADDEPPITRLVALSLAADFRVVTATGGEDALRKADETKPDLVLLDVVMPDIDGIEVMRRLREWRPVPVILMTAGASMADRTRGLDLGADDCVAKPFHPDELAARVRAVLRRAAGVTPGSVPVRVGDIEIDLERRHVTQGGRSVSLSRPEWLLLQMLATNAGRVVLHDELLTEVWGPDFRDDVQYLRVWISRVRRRLGAQPGEPGPIVTFQGIGYLLTEDGATVPRGAAASNAGGLAGQPG